MFWNGKKEVTKQDIRDIYAEELTKQGAKELWTLTLLILRLEKFAQKLLLLQIRLLTLQD